MATMAAIGSLKVPSSSSSTSSNHTRRSSSSSSQRKTLSFCFSSSSLTGEKLHPTQEIISNLPRRNERRTPSIVSPKAVSDSQNSQTCLDPDASRVSEQWLAMHNRLPTGARMTMWNSGNDGSCILCHQHLETRNHLFFACSYSSTVWKKLTQNLVGNLYSADWEDIVHQLTQGRISPIHRFLLRYVFQTAVHTIWRERNGRKHGDQSKSEDILFRMIDRQVKNRIATLKHDKRMQTAYQSWIGVVGT